MRFHLTRWSGTGTALDPFRPFGADEADEVGAPWDATDLRPDCTVPDGFALLATPAVLPVRAGRVVLTDDPDEQSAALRQRIGDRLGINVDDLPFRRMVTHLLRDHGDDANAGRWNRLRYAKRVRDDGRRIHVLEVHLGGLLHSQVIASDGPGTTLANSFTQPDGTSMGGSWTEVNGDWSNASNRGKSPTTGVAGNRSARWDADLTSSDHSVQAICRAQTAANTHGGVAARFASAAETYYRATLLPTNSGATNAANLSKVVAGVVTSIASASAPVTVAALTDYTVRVEANGSTITGYQDGVAFRATTDTTITTGTRGGIVALEATNVARYWTFDDWTASDLAAATDLVINDGAHAHTADGVALTRTHALAIADGSHSHSADAVTVTQTHFLAADDATHGHSADEVTVTQVHVLAVTDGTHAHSADEVVLAQVHLLVISDGLHGHTADVVTLVVVAENVRGNVAVTLRSARAAGSDRPAGSVAITARAATAALITRGDA